MAVNRLGLGHEMATERELLARREENRRAFLEMWGDDFDSLFENFLRPRGMAEETVSEGLAPRLDVVEHDNEFVLQAEMPGIKKDDIA